jgi:sugar phosphate isomerase/epimerase
VKKMKISIAIANEAPAAYPAIYKKDLFETVRKIIEFGYDGIEWHLRRPCISETVKMEKLCNSLGMAVNAIGTGMACLYDGFTLMHDDPEVRQKAVERLKEFVDMAATLGSTVIIGSMKGKIPPGGDRDTYVRYCIDSLKAVLDYAGGKAVPVVMEVLNRYETNFLNTVEQMDEFVTKAGYTLLKVHIDTFHMNIEEADMYESIIKSGNTLGHVHFADSNRYHPGAGHIDFKSVMRALKEINYQGWIGVECMVRDNADTDSRKAVEFIRSIESELYC